MSLFLSKIPFSKGDVIMKNHKTVKRVLLNLASLLIVCLFNLQSTNARTCPVNITDALADGPVPNVDPPAPQETPELDIDSVFSFVQQNNITTVKGLLDVLPDHMKGHYALVEKSRALHTSTPTEPSIMMYSVDGDFLLNIVVDPSQERYEVLDMAYLQDDDDGVRNGEWRFASLDFRQNPPALIDDTNTDINSACFECHGNPAEGKPPRPIWGNYLAWNDIVGDIKGEGTEELEQSEVDVLTNIKNTQATHDRYHVIKFPEPFDFRMQAGKTTQLPNLNYPYALTNSNMEIGTALVRSIVTRMKKSPNYEGLREELILVSYCQKKDQLDETHRDQIRNVLAESGNTIPSGVPLHRKHIYQALGLNYEHENAIPNLSTEPFQDGDDEYNLVSDELYNVIDGYIVHELMNENSQFKTVLDNIPDLPQHSPCGIPFGKLSDNLSYRHHQLYVLKGTARQAARANYFASQNFRYEQSFDEGKGAICGILKENISNDTIGEASNNTDNSETNPDDVGDLSQSIDNACQQGQTPVGNIELTAGNAVCLQNISNGHQIQMALNVPDNKTGSTLEIVLSHGSGNGDLLHRYDGRPSRTIYDDISNNSGNEERLLIQNVQRSWNYIHVRADPEFSGATLLVRYVQ
jgi:hypothetical protein